MKVSEVVKQLLALNEEAGQDLTVALRDSHFAAPLDEQGFVKEVELSMCDTFGFTYALVTS